MAKDPAFLFYPGDWLGGTMGMTFEEKGAYLELLVMQWNCHRIAEAHAKRVVGNELWQRISSKFSRDDKGFFNKRLEEEVIKRKQHSEKQKINANKRWTKKPCDGIANAMPLENEVINENENKNESKNFGKYENLLVPEMSAMFLKANPNYPANRNKDSESLFSIAKFLCETGKLNGSPETHKDRIIEAWEQVCVWVSKDNFYGQKSLTTISNHIQEIVQKLLHGKSVNGKSQPGSKDRAREFDKLFASRYGNGGSAVS